MTKDSNRIIGDILEINSDIIRQRVESTSPKFITKLKESHYRKRLDKAIKNIRKQDMILNKFNIQELLYYVYTYNDIKYDYIQLIKTSNIGNISTITAEFLIENLREDISNIKYVLSVSSKEPNISILNIIHKKDGTVETNTIRIEALYIENKDSDLYYAISILNSYLLEVMEKFLLNYLERFKYNKGYKREI